MIGKFVTKTRSTTHCPISRGGFIKRCKLTTVTILLAFFMLPHLSMAQTSQSNLSQANQESCRMVILGASYVAHWKIGQISGCKIINSGVNGDQTHQMLARFDQDVSTHQPDYVLVWGFINNISNSDPANFQGTKENIKKDLIEILGKVDSIGARPIVATEITLGFPPGVLNTLARWKNKLVGNPTWQQLVNEQVMDVNRWLTDLAGERGIPLLQFQQALSDENGFRLPAYRQVDGSHVTEEGYAALDRYVQSEQAAAELSDLQ